MRRYVIIAGVNGAGKTTLYKTHPALFNMPRVNIDEIVRSFGSWKNKSDVFQAGMIAVHKIREYIATGSSFNQETTLCGRSILQAIRTTREKSYQIELFYVGIESADLALQRINERVQRGGHGVPEEDVRRRYSESLKNLHIVIPMCDIVQIYDNTEDMRQLAEYRNGKQKWQLDRVPVWYAEWLSDVNHF